MFDTVNSGVGIVSRAIWFFRIYTCYNHRRLINSTLLPGVYHPKSRIEHLVSTLSASTGKKLWAEHAWADVNWESSSLDRFVRSIKASRFKICYVNFSFNHKSFVFLSTEYYSAVLIKWTEWMQPNVRNILLKCRWVWQVVYAKARWSSGIQASRSTESSQNEDALAVHIHRRASSTSGNSLTIPQLNRKE